jgi:hypothetical protein
LNPKLNRNYIGWEHIGNLEGKYDFDESDSRFQEVFASGDYYAKYDPNSDFWMFTKESSGVGPQDFRYPHYSISYTGKGSETKKEHLTYDVDCHIFVSSMSKNGIVDTWNEKLNDLMDEYPDLVFYTIY